MDRACTVGFTIFSGIVALIAAPCLAAEPAAKAPLAQSPTAEARTANTGGRFCPLFDNLGTLSHPVTAASPDAAAYCDQGLRWYYGFNFAEALRAYEQAAAIDPNCAMAYWGQAIVLGPSINHRMDPANVLKAHSAIKQAEELAKTNQQLTESERDYIAALALRYTDDAETDRAPLDRAYADAMRKLARKYPNDADAGTLFAAAAMQLRPWDYWARDGVPHEGTRELVGELERVLEFAPDHIGALHYYIHAVEASNQPERALAGARRLVRLSPGAGHLVHMPSHIFIRVGLYAEASDANRLAVAADNEYEDICRGQGFFALGYHPHNIHFLVATSMLEGNYKAAMDAAEHVDMKVPRDKLDMPPLGLLHQLIVLPLEVKVRFGRWQEILAIAPPSEDQPLLYRAIWNYARAMALMRQGELDAAARHAAEVARIADDQTLSQFTVFDGNNLQAIARIAAAQIAGELASARGNHDAAVAHLERAARLQDALLYDEPPPWPLFARQSLGAALLAAGRPVEAEQVYWEDLRRQAENGWSLFGVVQAREAQGNQAGADEVRQRFDKAWSGADVDLPASRF